MCGQQVFLKGLETEKSKVGSLFKTPNIVTLHPNGPKTLTVELIISHLQ